MTQACCQHCVNQLAFGPRLRRILCYLVSHADEWEHSATLEVIRFRILDRGHDASRVTYQTTSREQLDDIARPDSARANIARSG